MVEVYGVMKDKAVSDRVIGEIVGGDRAGQPAELEGTLLNLSEKSLIRQLILQVE